MNFGIKPLKNKTVLTLLWLSPGEGWDRGMLLHDAVGVNCKKFTATKIRAQVPSIWA